MKRLFLLGLGLLTLAAENLIVINLAQHATRERLAGEYAEHMSAQRQTITELHEMLERAEPAKLIYRSSPVVPLSTFLQRQQAVEAQQALVRATEEQAAATRRLAEQAETDAMERQRTKSIDYFGNDLRPSILLLYVSRRARSIPFHMRISHVTKKRSQEDFDPELDDQQRPTRLLARTTEQFEAIIKRSKAGEFLIDVLADGRAYGLWIFEVRYPAVDLHTRVRLLDSTEQVFGPDGAELSRLALLPNLDDPIDQLNAERMLLRYAVLEGQAA